MCNGYYMSEETKNSIIKSIYYDKSGFGSVQSTYQKAHKKDSSVRIKDVKDFDHTEAPRSSDLRALLFSTFPVIEKLPMGGTLLRHLLAQRAGNFQTESDFSILKLLFIIERELIISNRIQSDDLFFVLNKSSRL